MMMLRFGKLAAAGLVPMALAATVGAYITQQVAGAAGLKAIAAGCGVGLVGNWLGIVPVAMVADLSSREGGLAALMGTGIRFLAALVMTPVLALSGWVLATPFVVGVVISYMAILLGETIMLVVLTQADRGSRE
jgi:hypothetical protein